MFIYSPLEQFEIFAVTQGGFFNCHNTITPPSFIWELSLSNGFLSLSIICLSFIFFLHVTFFHLNLLMSNWLRVNFFYLTVIKNIINDLITHNVGKNYYFLFFSFVFILINIINLIGLIPYTFVLTSQFFFTFGLAFFFFMTLNITGIVLHGLNFLNLFYPNGTPLFIVPLLVLIEFISYIARVFSLAIRLFANITAGHILVKILSWLTWMVLDLIFLSSISFLIISILWVLEFFISILQAYVFLTLLCLYLNDTVLLH